MGLTAVDEIYDEQRKSHFPQDQGKFNRIQLCNIIEEAEYQNIYHVLHTEPSAEFLTDINYLTSCHRKLENSTESYKLLKYEYFTVPVKFPN